MPWSRGIGKEREDQNACERQSILFVDDPTRREILKIAIRKRKAFMLKALEETETPRHAIAKREVGECVEERV